jgi:ATP-binding cassette subfamily B protein
VSKESTTFGSEHWKWFFHLWKGYFSFGLFLVFLTLLSTTVAIGYPIYFKYLLDGLEQKLSLSGTVKVEELTWSYITILFAIGSVKLFASLYPFFRARMNLVIERNVRQKYFDNLLEKEHSFFNKFRTGDLVTRLTDDITGYPKISWFACSGFFRAFNSGSVVLFCVGAMLWLNWRLACITLIPLPLIVIAYMKIAKRLRAAYNEGQQAVSKTNNHLESCFSGIQILKAYNAEKRELARFSNVLDERMDTEMRIVRLGGKMHILFEFVSYAAQVLVILAGGVMAIKGTLTLGDYYAFFTYLGIIVYPMLDIPNLFVTSRQAFVCVDRLEEIKNYENHGFSLEGDSQVNKLMSIDFENVSFSFGESEQNVLDGISFSLKRGEKIAIVGQIGSGKTTLLNLVAGIYQPGKGSVKINDIPIEQVDMNRFRCRIGYITQEPMVFSQTVEENIKFWREASIRNVVKAAELGQFAKEINEFPEKYDQKLGQRGVNISGGQKQRLTISRAVMGSPELLLMDDVTASLDAENEEKFWNDMQDNFGSITALVVTHRLATALRADRLIVLDKGSIDSVGTFDELLGASEVFRKLVKQELAEEQLHTVVV